MSAPAPAPAPAPLPFSVHDHTSFNNPNSIPIPPPLSDKLLNLGNASKFFVNDKQYSHGRQWIATCLNRSGLIEVNSSLLPDPKCAFLFIQREYVYFPHELLSGKELKPCIAFIPCQGLLAEKSKFARILHQYYGSDARKITPHKLDCQ
eukprot:156624_1